MKKNTNRPPEPQQNKGKEYLYFLRTQVENSTGIPYNEFLRLPEARRFRMALKHVTASKKAVCDAFDLQIESMCREKRKLENNGLLVEVFLGTCPYTGSDGVAFLTTNQIIIKSLFDERI